MGYDVSFHPISPEEMREWYFTPLTWIQQGQEEKVLALAAQHGMEDFYAEKYLNTLRVGAETESNELFDKSHGFYIAVIQGFFRDYYYTRGSAFSFLVEQKPEYARYFTSWEQITPVSFPNPMQNRIIENYCSGVYLSPDQVIQLLKDMEQDPKVLEDLEGLWSNGQIAVLKKALSAAAKSGVGLLEATEVVEPNPISPNESTSYLYWVLNLTDENGKRKPKWIPTHKKVKGNKTWANNMLPTIRKEWTEKLLQEATASQQSASPSGPSSAAISFVDFLYQWLEYKYKSATGRVMDSKPIELSTYSGYEQQLNNPIAPYFREHPVALCDLTKQDILAFYEKELERVKPTTVKHYHALIHGALNYAVDKNLIPSNPADRIIISKPEPFKGDYYLDSEVLNLFEVIKGHKIELVVLLTAFYGLRRSEVIGLKWSAFDFNHNCFSIRHTVTTCNVKGERVTIKKDKAKNKSSLRTYPLIPFLKERLLEAKKQQEENRKLCGRAYNKEYLGYVCVDVIGNLIKPNYVSSTFGKLLAKNNLRHIRFHDLRHTCASLLLANGVPMEQVKEWLGHSEISTTVDIYGHLQYATKKQSAAAIEQDIVAPMLQNLSAVSP